MFTFADPVELWLEVPADLQASAWQFASYSNAANHWNGYLNQVCLEALLNWLRTEQAPDATGMRDRPAIWEVVNGSVIQWGDLRLAIMPTEAIDDAELAVPQEWVDIPDWAADYYLAVQVNLAASEPPPPDQPPEAGWIRVWGYVPYATVKASPYDPQDRSYSVDTAALTRDWSALWVTLQFCPRTPPQVAALPSLTASEADRLLQRLVDQPFPRLALPFDRWGALLQNSSWRQQLYRFRTQGVTAASPGMSSTGIVNLGQWLQQQVSAGWQSLDSLLGSPALGFGLRSAETAIEPQAKRLVLGDRSVALAVQLAPEGDRVAIVVQVYPMDQATLPIGLRLSLLDETGELLQTVESGDQDSVMQLRRFRAPSGTEFQVAVELGEERVSEGFVV